MTHGSEWDMEIWRPEVKNVTRGSSYFHVPRTTVCHMFCRMTKMAAWEFCLQDGGVSESFTHNMAACENCLQDMAAMQNKQNVRKNNVEYVLRLQCRIYLVNVTWPSDSSMSDVRHWTVWRSTVTRWTFDNAQRHVTEFRPISEAARS